MNKLTTEIFLEKSKESHFSNTNLNYSKTVYVNALTKVTVTCTVEGHGDFLQAPFKHMAGQDCPKCKGYKLKTHFVHDKTKFINNAFIIHFGKYGYGEVDYINTNTKVRIYCNVHTEHFLQTPAKHLTGQGCPKCSLENVPQCKPRLLADTISMAVAIHGNFYDYSKVVLTDCKSKVIIGCKRDTLHGEFQATMDNHIGAGSGCPKCTHIMSRAQQDLLKYVFGHRPDTISNKKLLDNTEVDIFIPSLNLAFEYNGIYWHGERYKNSSYHLKKTLQAESEGIRLIHIWEDEWILQRSKVENLVDNLLKICTVNYNARQGIVQKISWAVCSKFLIDNHLQGECAPTSMCYGLFIEEVLLSVMCFTTSTVPECSVELIRFCSKGNVRGGFSKILTYFIKNNSFTSIVSFSDKRWSQGNIYKVHNFSKGIPTPPTYFWCKGINRFHKRGFQHKYLENKLEVYDPNLSESENCRANGYFKLWDCGKDKWILDLKVE